ncbi:MAG: protein kinase [Planctomycetes bacterium]|nr:protein kinase [Planctomycetota bacterium]
MASASGFPSVPHYRMIKLEGKGASGCVYRARSESTDTLVAVKVLSRRLTSQPGFLSALQEGVKRLSPLRHRHVARVLGLERGGDHYALLTEFVEGDSLRDLLRQQGRIPEEQARQHILQAAQGLDASHRAGVLHQNLKPSNIFLSDEGIVKVMDFPLPVHPHAASGPDEHVYELLEVPLYLSPEQRRGKPLTVASNIFSLGVIYHHLLHGQPLLDAGGDRLPVRPEAGRSPVSEATRRTVERMTAERPEDRFTDYAELLAALESVSRPRVRLSEIGLCGGVAAILLLSCIFLLRDRGQTQHLPRAEAAPVGTETRPHTTERRPSDAGEEFRAAEVFQFQNPDDLAAAASRFERVAERHPDTSWAFDARRRLGELKEAMARLGEEGYRRLEWDVRRLAKQEHFLEAAERLDSFEAEGAAPGRHADLQALRKQIEKQEMACLPEALQRAERLAQSGRSDLAQKELEFIVLHARSSGAREDAQARLARLDRTPSSGTKTGPVNAPADDSPETLVFRRFASDLTSAFSEFKYSQAERLVRRAAEEFEDPEFRGFARTCLESIPGDQKFVRTVFSRIRQGRLPGTPALHTRGGLRLEVLWADWEGVSVTPAGDQKWGWKEFSPLEIYHLVEQCTSGREAADRLALAQFCFLRGLTRPLAERVEGDESSDASFKAALARYRCSGRLRTVLEPGE